MFERFTTAARGVVVGAQASAREFQHDWIGAEHLLLGLLADEEGVAARVLTELGADRRAVRTQVASQGSPDAEALKTIGIDLDAVRRQAEEAFGPGALDRQRRRRRTLFAYRFADGGHIPFNSEAKSALEQSLRAALTHGDNFIGSEHLLLGLLATKPGTALDVLHRVGVTADADAVRHRVLEELRRSA
jgi:ATP-dependent Clp protease ATP-binding subunit ClpA